MHSWAAMKRGPASVHARCTEMPGWFSAARLHWDLEHPASWAMLRAQWVAGSMAGLNPLDTPPWLVQLTGLQSWSVSLVRKTDSS